MKRIGAAILLIIFLGLNMIAAGEGKTVYITSANGKSVNMREEADRKSAVIVQLPVGAAVSLQDEGSTWSKVSYAGKTGYVQNAYLTSTKPAVSERTEATTETTAYITSPNGGSVHLRKSDSRDSESLASLAVGTKITVIKRENTWSQVRAAGKTGYVMNQYITSKKPEITAAPAATAIAENQISGSTAYVTSQNGKAVRIRKGPGTGYTVIGSAVVGTQVKVLKRENRWSYIQYGETNGYIMTQYLSSTKPSITPAPEVTDTTSLDYTMYVVSSNGKPVNVRAKASTSSEVVMSLFVGTEVRASASKNGWRKIQSGDIQGYMKNAYLSTTKPAITAVPSTATPSPSPTATAKQNSKEEAARYTAYVQSSNGKAVNVRQSASKDASVIGSLTPGTEVTVTGKDGSWSHISWGNQHGYMMSSYLTTDKPAQTTEVPGWKPAGQVRAYIASKRDYAVKTRTGPGNSYSVAKTYIVGTMVTTIENVGEWTKIRASGEESYVLTSNLASSGGEALPNSDGRLIRYLKSSNGNVKLRRARQADSDVLGTYANGMAIIVMSQNADEGWAYVKIGNKSGYIDIAEMVRKY